MMDMHKNRLEYDSFAWSFHQDSLNLFARYIMENDKKRNLKILKLADFKKSSLLNEKTCCASLQKDEVPELIRLRTEKLAQLLCADSKDLVVKLAQAGETLTLEMTLSDRDHSRLVGEQASTLESLRYVVESLAFNHGFSVQIRIFSHN